jgi:arylsulfatase A-like enzyme
MRGASPRRALRRATRLAAALGAGALAAGCSGGEPEASLLLVTLDTTRQDRLGTYGDPAARTPFFDALARRGTLYRQAFVDASTTLPSHASMLTGALSLRHGVRLNGAYRLPDGAITLTDRLRAAGWSTAAVLSSAALAARYGLDQGFDHYDDAIPDEYPAFDRKWWIRARRVAGNQRRAWNATDAGLALLPRLDAPAFFWMHYVDAHQPVDPPPPWDRVPGLPGYSAEVAVVDQEMGRFLREAERALGPAVVAVMADHGENLGEHHDEGHGLFLYEPVLRVPFVLAGPGVPTGIVSPPVRNTDLAPTLAALAGVDPRFPDGVDLLRERPGGPLFAETLAPTTAFGGAPTKTIRVGSDKLILSPRPERYDLERDPAEEHDLFGREPEADARLLSELEELVGSVEASREPGAAPAAGAAGPDAEQEAALRALGYLSAPEDPAPDDELRPEGLDPKDVVDVFWAVRYVDDGRFETVADRLDRFWREHPEPPDSTWHALFARAHFCEGALASVEGDWETARRHLRAALRLDPDYEEAAALLRQAP